MPNEFTRMRNPAADREAEIPTEAVADLLERGWEQLSESRSHSQALEEAAEQRLRIAAGEYIVPASAAVEHVEALEAINSEPPAEPAKPPKAAKVPKQASNAGVSGDDTVKE